MRNATHRVNARREVWNIRSREDCYRSVGSKRSSAAAQELIAKLRMLYFMLQLNPIQAQSVLGGKQMKRTWSAALICCLAATVASAQNKPCRPARHAKLPAITKLTYHKARKRLLGAGWQPLRTKSLNEAAADPDIAYGNGRFFWKRGYVEVEACSGTGVAACAFLFEDAYGNRLRVTTAGEEAPKEKGYARVTNFRFVCE